MDSPIGLSPVALLSFVLLSLVWPLSGQIGSMADPSAPRTSPPAFGADLFRGDGSRKNLTSKMCQSEVSHGKKACRLFELQYIKVASMVYVVAFLIRS